MSYAVDVALAELLKATTDILKGAVVVKVNNVQTGKIADGFTVRFIKEG